MEKKFDLNWNGKKEFEIDGKNVDFSAIIDAFFGFINMIFTKFFPKEMI